MQSNGLKNLKYNTYEEAELECLKKLIQIILKICNNYFNSITN